MPSNYLIERIHQLQIEYKVLLQILLPKLRTISFQPALEEIILFWIKNMDLVRLYLKHEIANKNSYIFTAATFLDFDDQEQFPFVLLGNHHVLDDPLCRYSEACNVMNETPVAEALLEQIIQTAEDNIKIIQGCSNNIIVLPLRLLRQSSDDSIHLRMAEQAFISLFNGINSIEEYFYKCETFADIMKYARSDIGSIVLFPGSDDQTLPFENRYVLAKEENSDMLVFNKIHNSF